MSADQSQVCPWCQMEITWDEELGPEPACPHCYNELTEYRTVTFPLKRDGDLRFEEESEDDWHLYTRAAEKMLDAQEEALECPVCQEYMVHAGEFAVSETSFTPKAPIAGLPPFLAAPFRVDLFICSHCFTVNQRLSARDRVSLVKRLGESQN